MARLCTNANGNYLSVGDVAAVDITGTALFLHVWAKPDLINDGFFHGLLGKDAGGLTTCQYSAYVDQTGKWSWQIGDASGLDSVSTAANASTASWSHVLFAKNGTGAGAISIYVNGVLAASATSNKSIQNTSQGLAIGNRSNNDIPFSGLIAEVAIFTAMPSAAQLAALAAGAPPNLVIPASLAAYWPLYGAGSSENDLSANHNKLTLTGTLAQGNHAPLGHFLKGHR